MATQDHQNQNQNHHHHHHSHRMDGASRFKYQSLKAIQRQKVIAKWGFRVLFALAVLSVIALIIVYIID